MQRDERVIYPRSAPCRRKTVVREDWVRIMKRILLLAGLYLIALPSVADVFPEYLELRYRLGYGSISLGTVTKTLIRENNTYRLYSNTEPTGLGSLLTSDTLSEEGRFQLTDRSIQPLSYRQTRNGSKTRVRTVSFDWDQNILTFGDGRQKRLPPGTLDAGSILFALMLAPLEEEGKKQVHITDGKNLRRYTYVRDGKEMLETPIGVLNTVRILRHNRDKTKTVTIWLATSKSNLPVKVVEKKNGRPPSTLIIESLAGL